MEVMQGLGEGEDVGEPRENKERGRGGAKGRVEGKGKGKVVRRVKGR